MSDAPAPTPSRKDRAIAKLVQFLARMLYRDVEVYWPADPPAAGPELTVANHFGGMADGLVLLYALPRRPGIIARDVIWKVPVVGRLMTWIGGIPVHKPEDGAGPASNAQMFGSCFEALRQGRHLLIFPEGVTRNEPSIARVRTGAARIVLGARDAGVTGIVITPVGIHYEDRAALRSRVVVNGGPPIAVDAVPDIAPPAPEGPEQGPDRDSVMTLTTSIDGALRRAAPDFADWNEARDLTHAADVALRTQLDDPGRPVPNELRVRLANVLAERSPPRRGEICTAVERYRADLDRLGLRDSDVVGARRRTIWLLALQLVVGIVLLPFALAGAVVNVIPFLVVKAVGLVRMAPSMSSTVKPIVAVVAFGVTWGVVIWWAASTWSLTGAAVAVVLLPVYLAAAIAFADRATLLVRSLSERRRSRRARSLPDQLADERDRVVEAVWAR